MRQPSARSPATGRAFMKATFSQVWVRESSWSATSLKRMIGPATSCGNIDT